MTLVKFLTLYKVSRVLLKNYELFCFLKKMFSFDFVNFRFVKIETSKCNNY